MAIKLMAIKLMANVNVFFGTAKYQNYKGAFG